MRKPQSDKPDNKAKELEAQALATAEKSNGHSPGDELLQDGSKSASRETAATAPASRQEIGTIEAGSLSAQSVSFIKPNKYHAIDDKELDYLMKFEKPISVAAAGVFAGIFAGTLWPAFSAFMTITSGSAGLTTGGVIFIVVCACSFGAAVATSVMAFRGKSDVVKALEAVRKRSKLYLPPNHPAVPTGSDGV
ncbi:MAG: hypothetical protein AAF495_14620 [Pseudomonadota bacterium]